MKVEFKDGNWVYTQTEDPHVEFLNIQQVVNKVESVSKEDEL